MPTMAEALQRQINVHDPYFNRGTMLPFGERTFPNNPHSRTEFAVPGAIYDPVMLGAKSMQQALSGQRVNPDDVTRLSLDLGMLGAPVGMATAPAGALAMGGARKAASHLPMDHASRMARADEIFPESGYHGTDANISNFSGGTWITGDPVVASHYADRARAKNYLSERADEFQDYFDVDEIDPYEIEGITPKGENVLPLRYNPGRQLDMTELGDAPPPEDLINWLADRGVIKKRPSFDEIEEYWLPELMVDSDRPTIWKMLEDWNLERDVSQAGYDSFKIDDVVAGKIGNSGVVKGHESIYVFDPKNIRSRFAAFDPAKKDSADLLAMNPATAAIPGLLPQQDDRKARMQNALMGNK